MPRLFIGTFLPEDKRICLAKLKDRNSDLEEKWQRNLRWVGAERMHMTWLFMGNLGNDLIQPIEDALQNLSTKYKRIRANKGPMEITFDKVEPWPDPHRARVMVITASKVDPDIIDLAKTIRTGLLEFYLAQSEKEEHRSFKPHVTLLRLERRQGQTLGIVKPKRLGVQDVVGLTDELPITLRLDKLSLIESQLGNKPIYQPLQEYSLAP